jgi:hypothetical protein
VAPSFASRRFSLGVRYFFRGALASTLLLLLLLLFVVEEMDGAATLGWGMEVMVWELDVSESAGV